MAVSVSDPIRSAPGHTLGAAGAWLVATQLGRSYVVGSGPVVALAGVDLALTQGIHDEAAASAVWQATPGRLTVSRHQPTGERGLTVADIQRLAHLPGLSAALPVLPAPIILERGEQRLTAGVVGLGPSPSGPLPYRLVAGAPPAPDRAESVVLSRAGAAALGFDSPSAATGQHLLAQAPGLHDMQLTVAGVAEELADANALVPLALAEQAALQVAGGDAGRETLLAERLVASLSLGADVPGLSPPVVYPAGVVVPASTSEVPPLAERLRHAGYDLVGAGQVPPALERVFQAVVLDLLVAPGVQVLDHQQPQDDLDWRGRPPRLGRVRSAPAQIGLEVLEEVIVLKQSIQLGQLRLEAQRQRRHQREQVDRLRPVS